MSPGINLIEFGMLCLGAMVAVGTLVAFVLYTNEDTKPKRYFCETCGEQVSADCIRRHHIQGACRTCGQLPGDGGIHRHSTGGV